MYSKTHQHNEKLNQIKITQVSLLPRNWNQSKQLTDKTYKNMQRLNDESIGSGSQTADNCKTDSIIVIVTLGYYSVALEWMKNTIK